MVDNILCAFFRCDRQRKQLPFFNSPWMIVLAGACNQPDPRDRQGGFHVEFHDDRDFFADVRFALFQQAFLVKLCGGFAAVHFPACAGDHSAKNGHREHEQTLNTRDCHWVHLAQNLLALNDVNTVWSAALAAPFPERITH